MLRGQKEELEFILQSHQSVCRLNAGQRHASQAVKCEKIETFVTDDDDNDYDDDYLLGPAVAKRPRPDTLAFAQASASTPSAGFPCFDTFLTPATGLTPMQALSNSADASLNTPSDTVNLLLL
jgi:hypothetical protein